MIIAEAKIMTQNIRTNFIARLDALGQIALTGEEAAHFLHNQITNDVENLSTAEARLAGYCTPKGRLLASFLMWRSTDTIYLQLPRDIQAAVQKRLQMFVLRAKAKLADVSDSHVAFGMAGAAVAELFLQLPTEPYAVVHGENGTLIRLPDADGVARYQWFTDPETAVRLLPELQMRLQPVGQDVWRLSEIRAGIPCITQATQEKFVPQMINFELLGGVNFRKGCYPGQEIVARSQYLGKLKRRMLLATVDDAGAAPGMEVFSSADPDQPCGMIVNAERHAPGASTCLVELKLAATEGGAVHLGAIRGSVLQFAPLPYPLTDPE